MPSEISSSLGRRSPGFNFLSIKKLFNIIDYNVNSRFTFIFFEKFIYIHIFLQYNLILLYTKIEVKRIIAL